MCGISGVLSKKKSFEQRIVNRMLNSIKHRGPDETNCIYDNEHICMGMNRLSIIDLKTGSQPQTTDDSRYTIVYNGEIYNFQSLKRELLQKINFKTNSDTEVILKGYAIYGTKIFEKLNGIFSLAIWDNENKTLCLARDMMGVKPLYYYLGSEDLYFSSEVKSFTENKINNKINRIGIYQFLHSGYIFHPETIIEDIKQLYPGEILLFNNNLNQIQKTRLNIPSYKEEDKFKYSENQLYEFGSNEIKKAVHRQMVSDTPVGLLLSSGTDSLTILSYLKKLHLTENLNTYSVTYDDLNFSEQNNINKITSKWGVKNKSITLTSDDMWKNFDKISKIFDNLELIPTALAAYKVSELASQDVKVVQAGIGGDELFGGYPTYKATLLYKRLRVFKYLFQNIYPLINLLPNSTNYLSISEKIKRFLNGFNYDFKECHFAWRSIFNYLEINNIFRERLDYKEILKYQTSYLPDDEEGIELSDLSYADLNTYQVDHALSMWDKASMASSVEVRVPLIDLELIKFMQKIPSNIRMQKIGSKSFLKKILKREIGNEFLHNRKFGFNLPFYRWLKEDKKNIFKEVIYSLPKDYFNIESIHKIVKQFENNRGDNGYRIWILMTLALSIKNNNLKF